MCIRRGKVESVEAIPVVWRLVAGAIWGGGFFRAVAREVRSRRSPKRASREKQVLDPILAESAEVVKPI